MEDHENVSEAYGCESGMQMSQSKRGSAGLRAGSHLAAVAAGLLLVASDASALWGDKLEVFVAESVTSDNNVFRISKDRDPQAFLGSADKGDTYRTTSLGFNVDIPVSRQRFLAGSTWNQVRYGRFTDLNHLGRDTRATWLWELGDQLSGQLGYTETEALASFSNIQGRSANPLKTQRAFGNAAYLLTPSWQLQAGLAGQAQRNVNQARKENDVDLQTIDMAVNYITPAGNKIGIGLRQDDGRYLNRQSISGVLYDNDYVQRGVGVLAEWAVTGKSKLKARVDRVHRNYDQLSQRNFDGTTYRGSYDWQATGKLAVSALAQRDISPAEDIQTSFVLVQGFSLRPSFDVSDKVKLTASADVSTREYLGDPGLALGTATGRTDRVRSLTAGLSYRPMRSLTLQVSGQRESRSSNVPLNDYTARILNINARFAF